MNEPKKKPIRFKLKLKDRQDLVRGKIVKKPGVEFFLDDIGYFTLQEELTKAVNQFYIQK